MLKEGNTFKFKTSDARDKPELVCYIDTEAMLKISKGVKKCIHKHEIRAYKRSLLIKNGEIRAIKLESCGSNLSRSND